MAQDKVRVVIEVRGGNVQAVYAGDFVEVVVVDWDNIKQGDTAGVLDPTPEPAMSDETVAQVAIARGEVASEQEPECPGLCGRLAQECAKADDPEADCGDRDEAESHGAKCPACQFPAAHCQCLPVEDQ